MRATMFSLIFLAMFSSTLIGCGEKTSTTKETTVSTPGGTTTVTTEREVETTGDNPPAAQP